MIQKSENEFNSSVGSNKDANKDANKDDGKTVEYFEFVKSAVSDGSYFKDSLNWYFFRYVNPFCERTILTLCSIVAAVIFFFLIQMIRGAFPLVEQVPIIVSAKDQTRTLPVLVNIKPKSSVKKESNAWKSYTETAETVDEAVIKYLLSLYVQNREGYDFSKAEISDVNKKYNYIKNNSSTLEYKEFQIVMSKDNPESPLNQFGQNNKKLIEIKSIKFKKDEPRNLSQKAMNFLVNKMPTEAEIRFVAITKTKIEETDPYKEQKVEYVAKIIFAFSGVNKDDAIKKPLSFVVSSYKLYKVKK